MKNWSAMHELGWRQSSCAKSLRATIRKTWISFPRKRGPERIGTLPSATMSKVGRALSVALGLGNVGSAGRPLD